MGSRAANVSEHLRSRSTSRGRSVSAGRSPTHRRSKSPARGKAESEKKAGTSPRIAGGRKSRQRTPQLSPSRQSLRLAEKTSLIEKSLAASFPEQTNGKKTWEYDFRNVVITRRLIDASGDQEPTEVQEKPEKIQVLRPEPLQPHEEQPRNPCAGILTLTLMIFLPVLPLSLGFWCSLKSCNFSRYPSIPRNLSAYLDVEVAVVLAAWLAFQFIIALIPLGGVRLGQRLQSDGKRLRYRRNGIFPLVANGLAIGILFYFKYPLNNWLAEKFLPLTVAATLFALFFSIWAFMRARRLPKEQLSDFGQNGNFFDAFYMGRELNPHIGGVDLKLFFLVNVGVIGWATVESFTLVEAFQKDLWSGAMLLVAGFQYFYLLDALLFQGSFASTAAATSDGLGFKSGFASLTWLPLVSSIHVRYLLLNPRVFCMFTAVSSTFLFLIGYVIFRCSSFQKDLIRQNPRNPVFSVNSTIPSSTGRPLLCTFWWRICRHPNYLGYLLMVTAWSLPCGFDCPLSYAFPLNVLFMFVVRIHEVEAQCRANHGLAWNRYTQKVTSRLIPWIY